MQVIDSTKPSNVRPIIVGVAGGSGSGKTYFAQDLYRCLGKEKCEILYQDNFYIDQSARFDRDGGAVNFDHPESLDFPLLAKLLRKLKSGHSVEIPLYDFVTHKRRQETLSIEPRPIIIVDGILIFHSQEVCALFDELVFFETPEELRFSRRLKRDVEERGRTPEGVNAQFVAQVKPMHDQFVVPSMKFAKTVVNEQSDYAQVLKEYVVKLSRIKEGPI